MSKLAILGGKPVTENLLAASELVNHRDLEKKYLQETFESGIWDDWPEEQSMASKFQNEWAEFNNSKFCALATNGTHTLQLALEALDIGFGDEVIVPGLTWQATASAVCDVNAIPIIVDVEENTLCIDPKCIEAAITPKTRAIIPVHLYHRMANMDEILNLAKRYNLFVGKGKNRRSFVPLIAKHFLAGRGEAEYGFGNQPEFIDIACVGGIRVKRMSGFEMIGLVEELSWHGLWVILAFHNINGDRLSVQREDYLMLLDYLKRNENTIWTAPVRQVAQKIIDIKRTI